jgi:hypothetical protein
MLGRFTPAAWLLLLAMTHPALAAAPAAETEYRSHPPMRPLPTASQRPLGE